MRVSDLYNKPPFADASVYIIGTGPSVSVFPIVYLKDKFCILLNDACQSFSQIGPVAFSNNRNFLSGCNLPYQIVKARLKFDPHMERDDNHVRWNDPRYYCFSYRDRDYDEWDHFDERALWNEPDHFWNTPGGNACIFCIQFCLSAGVKEIHLVGCDCCHINKEDYHEGKQQRRRRKHDYDAYAKGTLRMIREARERFGVPIVQVTPFAGLGREKEQYKEMKAWKPLEFPSALSRCN